MPCFAEPQIETVLPLAALARCVGCHTALGGSDVCPRCERSYPVRDGIWEAIGSLAGTNRIAADFYDGPGWTRFRPFEQLFLWFQGPGPARARRKVLRFLPRGDGLRVLEVGIGAGENVPLLPPSWSVYGVDIARTQLVACAERFPALRGKLAWAEGESLPFVDQEFDAVFSVGGFNYFRDPEAALREMRRVTRPGATVVVADEIPDLHRLSPASALGLVEFNEWSLGALGLDRAFIEMVLNHPNDLDSRVRAVWPAHRRVAIWHRLGYSYIDPPPTRSH
ncbi:MAG: class I SAM-dependent methyltransferase [Isosphaeraceae bacterium]|nr:class I SAM-dependent methyltransferase [Isosphaeraceae bacterium]